MPRNPSGVAQPPSNTSAVSGDPISSTKYNSIFADVYSLFNTAWPEDLLPVIDISDIGGQPVNANLTSLSLLGTVADRLAYTTALNTWAETPLTAFGRTLIDDADAATARTTLGAQASDATLTSLSGLSLVEGDMLYATAADTVTRLPKGTASQILVMNSGATAPEWTSAVGDSDTQVFAANGTWTKPAWATANSRVFARIWGGGGGGAGGGTATGGSGAAYVEAWFLASDLSATESVTVGTGGAGTTSTANGSNGGDTTFKTFTAGGGLGGNSSGGVGVAGGAVKKGGATFIAGGAAGALAEGWQGGGSESSSTGTGALKSIFGGAGGGSRNGTRTGGLSMFGGNGGDGSTSAGENGSAPGGGGGAVGGDGGDGLAIITTFR